MYSLCFFFCAEVTVVVSFLSAGTFSKLGEYMGSSGSISSLYRWIIEKTKEKLRGLKDSLEKKYDGILKAAQQSRWNPKYYYNKHQIKKFLRKLAFLLYCSEQWCCIMMNLSILFSGNGVEDFIDSEVIWAASFYNLSKNRIRKILQDLNDTEQQVEDIGNYLRNTGIITDVLTATGAGINFANPTVSHWWVVGTGVVGIGAAILSWVIHKAVLHAHLNYLTMTNELMILS